MQTPTEHLRAVPLFAGLSKAGLTSIAERATEITVPAGQVMIEVGQAGAGLFVVEDGTLEVDLSGGRTKDVGPGGFVGEIALLTDHMHVARVRAKTDVRCVAISRADFAALLGETPELAVAMLPTLAARVVEGT